jgi:hypothetical protein
MAQGRPTMEYMEQARFAPATFAASVPASAPGQHPLPTYTPLNSACSSTNTGMPCVGFPAEGNMPVWDDRYNFMRGRCVDGLEPERCPMCFSGWLLGP